MKKSNGEGSIWTEERNGKTYFRGSVTVGIDEIGKPIRKTIGSFKKSVVIEKMNELRSKGRKRINTGNRNITFGEFFLSWIYDYKRNEVQNNTFAEYETCYRLRISPYNLSRIRMNEITLDMLQRYFNQLKSDNLSLNVIKKTYVKLNACFSFAEIHGIIEKNYCKGVVIGKEQKKREEQYKAFTKEEQERIINALDLRNIIDCIIYFTFFTGLRLGEVLAVRWEDIQGNMLSVRGQFQKDIQIDENGNRKLSYVMKDKLKTAHSEREIPLPKRVIEMLNHMLRLGDLLFCDEKGQPIEVKRPPRKIKKLCEVLEIPHRSFHSIRHTYATRLFEMDVPIKTVQALLGHSDIQTTMNIYTHVMKDKKLEIVDKLDEL